MVKFRVLDAENSIAHPRFSLNVGAWCLGFDIESPRGKKSQQPQNRPMEVVYRKSVVNSLHVLRIILATLWAGVGTAMCHAQQPLNLDFENLSVEGMARPWGWELETYGVDSHLDSLEKQHGRYSMRIRVTSEGDALELQRLLFAIEPYQLRDAVLTVGGWVKTSALNGRAYFALRFSTSENGDDLIYDTTSTIFSGDTNWQYASFERHIPANVKTIDLMLYADGKGTAWFDNLTLSIDGQVVDQVVVAPAFSESDIERLAARAHPLAGVDAAPAGSTASYTDLDEFRRLVGDARIIALGESTHGTSEFFRLKHRVLEYAVKELGVRVFAIEDNQLVVERVNKYVLGGPGTARSSMYGMFSVWQNEEVHDMIAWVRRFNDLNKHDKVEFVGFDIQNLALPVDSLLAFLSRRSPELAETSAQLLGDLKENGMNGYFATESVKLGWLETANQVWNQTTPTGAGVAVEGNWATGQPGHPLGHSICHARKTIRRKHLQRARKFISRRCYGRERVLDPGNTQTWHTHAAMGARQSHQQGRTSGQ